MTTRLPRELSNSVPILLLPPSEGKAEGGRDRHRWSPESGAFGRALGDARAEVVAALGAVRGGDGRLLGVSGDHLTRAQSANRELIGAPTLPAWRRYTGVVWDHLDPAGLEASARRRILVVSGLHGVVRGDDPIPDYRLKMGANLPPLGKLSTSWRPTLTAALDRYARGRSGGSRRVLVDLLPKEHRAAWTPGPGTPVIRVELVDERGAAGGHFAKAAKGRLAGAILRDGLDALRDWTDERYELAVETPA